MTARLWDYIDVCNEGDVDAKWLTEADHLAALERVRVETLRDARRAVASADPTERLGLSGQGGSWRGGHNDALAAIDRLIDAATTGDTDD